MERFGGFEVAGRWPAALLDDAWSDGLMLLLSGCAWGNGVAQEEEVRKKRRMLRRENRRDGLSICMVFGQESSGAWNTGSLPSWWLEFVRIRRRHITNTRSAVALGGKFVWRVALSC